MLNIRPAKLDDLRAITDIYNEAVMTTVAAFDIEPKTEAEQQIWFEKHSPRRPMLVAELDSRVVGWASLSDWSHHGGYYDTVEVSVYIKEDRYKRIFDSPAFHIGGHCAVFVSEYYGRSVITRDLVSENEVAAETGCLRDFAYIPDKLVYIMASVGKQSTHRKFLRVSAPRSNSAQEHGSLDIALKYTA